MKKFLILILLISSQKIFSQVRISAEDASKHIGDSVVVCDKVFGAKYLDHLSLTLLDVGQEFPYHYFSIVIKGANRDKFKTRPEQAFKGKRICVTGVLSLYAGKPQIIIYDPSQIKPE